MLYEVITGVQRLLAEPRARGSALVRAEPDPGDPRSAGERREPQPARAAVHSVRLAVERSAVGDHAAPEPPHRITSYNVCYTKLLRSGPSFRLYPRFDVA